MDREGCLFPFPQYTQLCPPLIYPAPSSNLRIFPECSSPPPPPIPLLYVLIRRYYWSADARGERREDKTNTRSFPLPPHYPRYSREKRTSRASRSFDWPEQTLPPRFTSSGKKKWKKERTSLFLSAPLFRRSFSLAAPCRWAGLERKDSFWFFKVKQISLRVYRDASKPKLCNGRPLL